VAELLATQGLTVGYHGRPVLSDLDLTVRAGELVALLGANGVGKTTTLHAIAGALSPLAGRIILGGRPTSAPPHVRARRGLAYVADDRSVFSDLTVAENLRVGRGDPGIALDLFPELRPLWSRRVGLLSGGEQQMLAVGRAIARRPAVLLVDELSLGLGPMVVARLLRALREVADAGSGILVVEQHVGDVLRVADQGYVLGRGRVLLSGSAPELLGRLGDIEAAYLLHAPTRPGDGG
jgi:branched-chain amino acid transport system ATP-binding protein